MRQARGVRGPRERIMGDAEGLQAADSIFERGQSRRTSKFPQKRGSRSNPLTHPASAAGALTQVVSKIHYHPHHIADCVEERFPDRLPRGPDRARLSRKIRMVPGGQRDSNPQQPEPQSGALPLSYGHRRAATLIFSRPIAKAKQQSRPRRPLQALGASAILRRPWDE